MFLKDLSPFHINLIDYFFWIKAKLNIPVHANISNLTFKELFRIWWWDTWVCRNIVESAWCSIPSMLLSGELLPNLVSFDRIKELLYPWIILFKRYFSHSKCRNERGREMLNLIENLLEITPTISSVICDAPSHNFALKLFLSIYLFQSMDLISG